MRMAFQKNESAGGASIMQARPDLGNVFHYERQRLNHLFKEAGSYPMFLVCAGAGYGKTSAVQDFVREYQAPTAWMQISERDNVPERFWENYAHTWGQINESFASAIRKIGFPDTADKQKQYLTVAHKALSSLDRRIFVLDDIHYLENPLILRLAEYVVNNLAIGTTTIWISRSTPRGNTASMVSRGKVFNVSENDLRFSENEMAQYFRQLEIFPQAENIREIMHDTGGWAFAINLIARFYHHAPGYGGYLRSAMKTNIFHLMETDIWDGVSERVQSFLIRLSLIGHLSFELIELLAGGDESLITEMERQNAYIRRDSYINAYLIHPLFLEYLATKQKLLAPQQIRETYIIAGEWCDKNGFKIDAISYFEKIGDYGKIIEILYSVPAQFPYDLAKYGVTICDRAPAEAYDTVSYLAISHVRCNMRLGFWAKAMELAEYYEAKFLELPEDDNFRNINLGGLYLTLFYFRYFACVSDGIFDCDRYLEKFINCPGSAPVLSEHSVRIRLLGPWANANGSPKKGMPEKYIEAVSRASAYMPQKFSGYMGGEVELAWGELRFFQGDMGAAESYIAQAMVKAREHRQFEILHRAHLYSLRLSVAQGNYAKMEQAMKEIKTQLSETEDASRYTNYNIAFAYYCYVIDSPENFPDWLKQTVSPYSHAGFIENLENQMKIRYFYMTRNYPPVLAYIQEMRQRESYLFGRVTMLAMEACIHYKLKDRKKAFKTLLEAYETAAPNELVMPFIELGKDMRTLTNFALKEAGSFAKNGRIPRAWLEAINRKSASFAKRHAHFIAQYREANGVVDSVAISPRETDILTDLSHGLSRAEIASTRSLSINTVKMVINNLYSKLGAENMADLIRIAVERKMI